ncbi:hypothetical protein [Sandaracinus amylolyticus]|uniref:Uncharacterized protein n=1 Tax=Sandaracinus amylolyticus TaxID=927083 RepID=A0A0F6W5E1_9BACT|nr:hypothetical protein [Sandaracinus amylolyticus]AKF07861.1 hypothetical protein DB32_005010 [Sandaracinus amylolyticus]
MTERSHLRRAFAKDALALALSLVTCPFAIVLTPQRTSLLLGSALALAGGSRDARRGGLGPGALAIGLTIALVIASLVGLGAARAVSHSAPLAIALAIVLPSALGVVLAPFVLAPVAWLDREEGVVAALVRAFELAVRRGALPTLRDGASLGALVGIAASLGVAFLQLDGAAILVAVWASIAIGAPIGASVLARAYVDGSARAAFDGATDAQVSRGLRRVAVLVTPAAWMLAIALVAAMLTPSPMRRVDHARALASAAVATVEPGDELVLPGDHGLVVAPGEDGVLVRTADGGGAGHVAWKGANDYDVRLSLLVVRTRFRDVDAWALVFGDDATFIDDEGVRLDDSFTDRLAARLDVQSLALVLIALVALAWWSLRLARAMARARALDAPRSFGDAAPDPATLVQLVGRLRYDEGSYVEGKGTSASVTGAARVVSLDGAVVIVLPAHVPLLVPSDAKPDDGAEVTVVARAGALSPTSFRQGAAAWPDGAKLVLADRDEAAEQLLERAARGASLVALLAAVMLGGVALAIAARL